MPLMSTWPSGVRGAGAVMFTVPSGFLGTFGVLTDGHWASSDGDSAAKSANTTDPNTLIPVLQI